MSPSAPKSPADEAVKVPPSGAIPAVPAGGKKPDPVEVPPPEIDPGRPAPSDLPKVERSMIPKTPNFGKKRPKDLPAALPSDVSVRDFIARLDDTAAKVPGMGAMYATTMMGMIGNLPRLEDPRDGWEQIVRTALLGMMRSIADRNPDLSRAEQVEETVRQLVDGFNAWELYAATPPEGRYEVRS